jgi:hypothetical protein
VSFLRPLRRRRRSTSRPCGVLMRLRKPCVRFRLLRCGWYVLFTSSSGRLGKNLGGAFHVPRRGLRANTRSPGATCPCGERQLASRMVAVNEAGLQGLMSPFSADMLSAEPWSVHPRGGASPWQARLGRYEKAGCQQHRFETAECHRREKLLARGFLVDQTRARVRSKAAPDGGYGTEAKRVGRARRKALASGPRQSSNAHGMAASGVTISAARWISGSAGPCPNTLRFLARIMVSCARGSREPEAAAAARSDSREGYVRVSPLPARGSLFRLAGLRTGLVVKATRRQRHRASSVVQKVRAGSRYRCWQVGDMCVQEPGFVWILSAR